MFFIGGVGFYKMIQWPKILICRSKKIDWFTDKWRWSKSRQSKLPVQLLLGLHFTLNPGISLTPFTSFLCRFSKSWHSRHSAAPTWPNNNTTPKTKQRYWFKHIPIMNENVQVLCLEWYEHQSMYVSTVCIRCLTWHGHVSGVCDSEWSSQYHDHMNMVLYMVIQTYKSV